MKTTKEVASSGLSGLALLQQKQANEILCAHKPCPNAVAEYGQECGAHDPPKGRPRGSTDKKKRAPKKLPSAPARIATMQHKPDHPRHTHVSFEVPLKVISEANVSQREKWHTKNARHKQQRRVVALTFKLLGAPLPKALYRVTLTRIAAQSLDSDNLRPALKHVRDEVAFVLGIDDASPLVEWDYKQETATHAVVNQVCKDGKIRKVKQYDYRVRVQIDPLN